MKKAVIKKSVCSAAVLLLCASCFALPVEEPALPPPTIQSVESTSYKTTAVGVGDVTLSRDINAQYVSAREEALSFAVNDVYIKAVYVEVGDFVRQGDIIAELERDYFIEELERAAQEESWARLSLSQLEERHRLNLLEAEVAGQPLDEAAYLDERDALLTQLEGVSVRQEYLRFEDGRRVLRAGMDGTVTYVMSFREGDTSTADQRVVTVTDQTQSVFMVRGSETEYLETGTRYELIVDRQSYDAEVVDPDELGISRTADDEKYLVIVEEEPPQFSTNAYAALHLILDEVYGVTYINYSAVKKANARVFVYVLENGLREIRDIEIGLEGNTFTEVISGLTEGELVIMD